MSVAGQRVSVGASSGRLGLRQLFFQQLDALLVFCIIFSVRFYPVMFLVTEQCFCVYCKSGMMKYMSVFYLDDTRIT